MVGAVAYVPDQGGSDRVALRRFYSAALNDHRDCPCSTVAGYTTEGVHGAVWTSSSAVPGLDASQPITIGVNGNDYATYIPRNRPSGYTDDLTAGWGYPRYGNASEDLLTLSGGGVTISSNRVAGGALWSWTDDGYQYVNTDDYGREIQADLYFYNNADQLGITYKQATPTEAGAINSSSGLQPAIRHGSPLLSASNTSSTSQSTRSIPLEWTPSSWGGSIDLPVIWHQLQLGKDITLDYLGLGAVALYETVLYTPQAIQPWVSTLGGSPKNPFMSMPAMYLNGGLNRFWTYEPTVDPAPKEVSPGSGIKYGFGPGTYFSSGRGSVILSDTTGDHAMAIYTVGRVVGGTAVELNPINLSAYNTNALIAWTGPPSGSSFPAGETRNRSWIASGTLAEVQASIDALRAAGVS